MSVRDNIYLPQSFGSPFISHHAFDICLYCPGVSGAKGRDLGLGSKILDSASGVNNSGLTREQLGLCAWRERGHETSVWASGIQVDSERGTQLLNGEQGIWLLGPAVQRVPCKWPCVFHGCPKARMSDLELSIFPTLELGPGKDRVARALACCCQWDPVPPPDRLHTLCISPWGLPCGSRSCPRSCPTPNPLT